MTPEEPIFVKSAQISAHLYFATEIAKRISITSKNARVITARAGIQASGYTAITAFIEELSQATFNCSKRINHIAVNISHIATERVRAEMAHKDFQSVLQQAKDAQFIDSIKPIIQTNFELIEGFNAEFTELIDKLISELDESKKQVRTADVLVSTAKIEASKSGVFEKQLNVIADNLESDAVELKKQIKSAEIIIDSARRSVYASH